MAQMTAKELDALSDLLNMESVFRAKCNRLADETEDKALADCYARMAQNHGRHFDELYANLK